MSVTIAFLISDLKIFLFLIILALPFKFIGGATIKEFLVTMMVGVIIGTYSSIAIAAQFLVSWEAGDFDKVLQKIGLRKTI